MHIFTLEDIENIWGQKIHAELGIMGPKALSVLFVAL
jgi:hypothetical protein